MLVSTCPRKRGGGSQCFMSPLQGLKKILGTSDYPGRCPGLVYFALVGRKMDSLSRLWASLRVPLSRGRQVFVFTPKYWIPAFAGMTVVVGGAADGFAIAALRFASCPVCAGMTEGERGGRWIRYRGSGLRFVSRFRGNDSGGGRGGRWTPACQG